MRFSFALCIVQCNSKLLHTSEHNASSTNVREGRSSVWVPNPVIVALRNT